MEDRCAMLIHFDFTYNRTDSRGTWLYGNKFLPLLGSIFGDFFDQPQLQLRWVNLRIVNCVWIQKLVRERPEFSIIKFYNMLDVKISIQEAFLYMKNISCFYSVWLAQKRYWESKYNLPNAEEWSDNIYDCTRLIVSWEEQLISMMHS